MNELFNDLPDVLDAKALAHALSISKSGTYILLNQKDFPTLRIGGRKLVTKPDLICWMDKHISGEFPDNNLIVSLKQS